MVIELPVVVTQTGLTLPANHETVNCFEIIWRLGCRKFVIFEFCLPNEFGELVTVQRMVISSCYINCPYLSMTFNTYFPRIPNIASGGNFLLSHSFPRQSLPALRYYICYVPSSAVFALFSEDLLESMAYHILAHILPPLECYSALHFPLAEDH